MNLFEAAKNVPIIKVARELVGIEPEHSGSRWQALCPFHEDTDPSLVLDEEKNLWKCFGCDRAGSNIDLVIQARLAYNPREAAELIVGHFGIQVEKKEKVNKKQQPKGLVGALKSDNRPFNLSDYAELKKLPVEFLTSLEMEEEDGKVRIPYSDRHQGGITAKSAGTTAVGTTAVVRYRSWHSFWWARGIKPILYGLNRLDHFLCNSHTIGDPAISDGPTNSATYVILVEGESDTQTLWLHGYPAIGVPGAGNFKPEWTKYLVDFEKIYIHREPDKAGQKFVQRIAGFMDKVNYSGQTLVFSVEGFKDPNELHQAHWPDDSGGFKAALDAALAAAVSPGIGEPDQDNEELQSMTVEDILDAVEDNPVDVFTQPTLSNLAGLSTADQARVKAAVKGKVSLTDLNKAIKEESRRRRVHLRAVGAGNKPKTPSLQDLLDDCPADIPMPAGWQVSGEGVYELVSRQAEAGGAYQAIEQRFPVPVVLTCVQKPLDVTDETTAYELAWQNEDSNWHRTAFPATTIFDKARLINTASVGLPVDSENARGLLRWLAALRDMRALPTKKVVTRCGWHNDNNLYVLGSNIMDKRTLDTMNEEVVSDDTPEVDDAGEGSRVDWTSTIRGNEKELVDSFRTQGDPVEQQGILFATAVKYPLAGFLMGAAAAAPLMRLLYANGYIEIHGFVVEVTSDQAGVGKTTGQELAASVFGNPGHMVRTFDRTTVAWEVLLHTMCDCPVFLEEAQMQSKEDMASKLVYALALGMGRERGNRSGGLRVTRQFFNIALLASERSLKTFAAREGVEARVISLPPVFGEKSPERGEELRRLRRDYFSHYGHAGLGYVRYLLKILRTKNWDRVIERFDKACNELTAAIPPGINDEARSMASRMATRVAVCWVAQYLLIISMGIDKDYALEVSKRSALEAWKHIIGDIDAVPLWKRALAVIQSYAAENAHRIAGMEVIDVSGRERVPSGGYIGGVVTVDKQQAIGFFPNAFDDALKKHLGIEGQTVRKGLVREGVVITDKQGKTARSQRIRPAGGNSFTARVICVPKDLIFPPEEEPEMINSPVAEPSGSTRLVPEQPSLPFSWNDL